MSRSTWSNIDLTSDPGELTGMPGDVTSQPSNVQGQGISFLPAQGQAFTSSTKLPYAMALQLGKQLYNAGAQGVNWLGNEASRIPGVSTIRQALGGTSQMQAAPMINANPLQALGIPQTRGNQMAMNVGSGVMGSLIPGPDILEGANAGAHILNALSNAGTQAGVGAAMDPNNRGMGALFGGGGRMLGDIAGGIRGIFATPAQKIAALQAQNENVAQNAINQFTQMRKANINNAQNAYSLTRDSAVAGHPVQSLLPNKVADDVSTFGGPFNTQQAAKYYQQNSDQLDKLYPGFSSNVSGKLTDVLGADFVTPLARLNKYGQLDSVQSAMNDLVKNPTIGNADALQTAANTLKGNPNLSTEQTQYLEGLGSKVKSNITMPALKDFDSVNGTNLSDAYAAGDVPWQAEKTAQGLGKDWQVASTGGPASPVIQKAGTMQKMLSSLLAKNKLTPDMPEYSVANNTLAQLNANNIKMAQLGSKTAAAKAFAPRLVAASMQKGINAAIPAQYAANLQNSQQ